MRLRFTKMQGLGNDFVVVDAVSEPVSLTPEQLRLLGDRHFGVGCDQILVVEPPPDETVDFRYRIFNADGGEVEQCGNGARCFARFVYDRGLTDKTDIDVLTAAGVIHPRLEADGRVTVDMGEPRLEPSEIPFEAMARATVYPVDVAGEECALGVVSMGNPHAVLQVDDVDHAPLDELGRLLERHSRFPQRVNVGFMQVMGRDRVRLRVFERGVGETLACGTGACAAVVAGRLQGLLDERVRAGLSGGDLDIHWVGEGSPVLMTGPAESGFEGVIEL
jgi:diaminopimelate epimerase